MTRDEFGRLLGLAFDHADREALKEIYTWAQRCKWSKEVLFMKVTNEQGFENTSLAQWRQLALDLGISS